MVEAIEQLKTSLVGLRKIFFGTFVFVGIWAMYWLFTYYDWIKPNDHFQSMLDASVWLAGIVLGANVARHGVAAWETRGGGNDSAG